MGFKILLIIMLSMVAPAALADGRLILKRVLMAHAQTDGFRAGVASLGGEMISIGARLSDGGTLLHLAARNGEEFLVEHLLQRGANPHAIDASGRTGYAVAVKSGEYRAAALLLSHMQGVNALDEWGRSPISLALKDMSNIPAGAPIATKLMLKGGDADLGAVEDDELSYLRGVGFVSDGELRKALLTNANIIPYFAADNDIENLERALRLLPEEIDDRPIKNRAFLIAASHTDLEAMNILIAHGVDADIQDDGFGLTPLMVAINNRNGGAVSKLLNELRANPDIQDQFGNTALHHACTQNGCITFVKELLAAGADPALANKRCCAPLVLAVMAGRDRAAALLLDAMPELKVLKKLVESRDGKMVSGVKVIADAIEESEEFRRVFADVADELEYLRSNVFTRLFQRILPRGGGDNEMPVSSK